MVFRAQKVELVEMITQEEMESISEARMGLLLEKGTFQSTRLLSTALTPLLPCPNHPKFSLLRVHQQAVQSQTPAIILTR